MIAGVANLASAHFLPQMGLEGPLPPLCRQVKLANTT